MTTHRIKLAVLGMASLLVLSWPSRGQQASVDFPPIPNSRPRINTSTLTGATRRTPCPSSRASCRTRPAPWMFSPSLASDQRADVRVLVATLLGELGEPEGAKTLWHLTRDDVEFVRTTAAGSLVRLAGMTPIVNSWEGLKDHAPRCPQTHRGSPRSGIR